MYPSSVEEDIHFLIKCNLYGTGRKTLFDLCRALKPNFDFSSDQEKFTFILTNSRICKEVAKFVPEAMDKRDNRRGTQALKLMLGAVFLISLKIVCTYVCVGCTTLSHGFMHGYTPLRGLLFIQE